MHVRIQEKAKNFFRELRHRMRSFGFVHITGLHWTATMYQEEEGFVQACRVTLCRWSHDDDTTIAILENGEVWMRHGEFDQYAQHDQHLRNFLRRCCPKGKGAQTNLPGNYVIDFRMILDRANDAYSARYYDSTPRPF